MYFWRYNKSRFFSSPFFMQQLSRKTVDMLHKSCRNFYHESSEMEFAFFMIFLQFSMHFTRFNIFTLDLEETDLQTGPSNSQIGPQHANLYCNWVPGAMADGGSSIPARGRPSSVGKGRGSIVGLPRVPFCGLLAAEEQLAAVLINAGRRWLQGASAPARSRCGQVNAWHRRLQRTIGWRLGGLGDTGCEWRWSSATAAC
jgi:hypothetical protein